MQLASLVAIASALSVVGALVVAPTLDINKPYNNAQNLTLGATLYPKIPLEIQFLYTTYEDKTIDLIPCTVTGADLIWFLAKSQVWTTPITNSKYSSPPIEIEPVRNDRVNDFQTRYAVWGIFYGLVKMWNEVSDRNAIFPRAKANEVEVWLDDVDQGRVRFVPPSLQAFSLAEGVIGNDTSLTHSENSTSSLGSPYFSAKISFIPTDSAHSLTRKRTVLAALAAITEMAGLSNSVMTTKWERRYDDLDAWLVFESVPGGRYHLDYDVMVRTLSELIQRCANRKWWHAMDFTIERSGERVGKGSLMSTRCIPQAFSGFGSSGRCQ